MPFVRENDILDAFELFPFFTVRIECSKKFTSHISKQESHISLRQIKQIHSMDQKH